MKRIYLFFWILVSSLGLGAQSYTPPSPADIDTNYRSYVNNVFGALEASRVPTGLLSDYGFDFTDPKIYNGTVLVDSTLMEQGIYSEPVTLRTTKESLTVEDEGHERLNN